jgi:hypothetical protein
MTLIESWKDSLRVLTPQGLKELGIATWGTIKEVFRALGKPRMLLFLGILLGAFFLLAYFIDNNVDQVERIYYKLGRIYGGILVILVFLAALPTPQIKDLTYFANYFKKYIWGIFKLLALIITAGVLVVGAVIGIALFIEQVMGKVDLAKTIGFIEATSLLLPIILFLLLVWSLKIIIMLFYIQHTITIRSAIKKSVFFVIYNFPLFLICTLILIGIYGAIDIIVGERSLIHFIIVLFEICVGINILTRRINANPALYQ